MLVKFCCQQIIIIITIFYLGGHDKLVVDDVVRSVAHTKQGAGGMEVTWHACPHVHIFTDSLQAKHALMRN